MEVKTTPAMDVVAAPVSSGEAATKEAPAKPEPPKAHQDTKPSKPAKPPRDGNVIAAIFATVIIVLGLAALAVFAYLKQTGKI